MVRRWLALTALGAALAEPGLAAKLTATEHTNIEEPRPADVPSDAVLEASGAVIGTIDIDIRNIFDKDDPRENSGLYRLANKLHLRTKRGAIKAQLLFKSGDPYRAQKLAETERNLRMLLYVYDAHVYPVHYADGKVDVKVITKDVWTLSPGISFGRSGGTNSTSYNLQDSNFLGWGKTVQISRSSNVDRTSNTIDYVDPNVFGSRWTSGADGRPFQRRIRARRAVCAALLFARYALERQDLRGRLRSHRVALLPGQHRRSIQ